MKQTYNKISPLIKSQFPGFYREEGPLFVEFVKNYYQWLESTGNPLYYSRNLLNFSDVDSTLDQFLPHYQQKYLAGVSLNGVEQKRDLIKHALDIHRTKGTIQSLRLVFELLFGEKIQVYYPGDDILRTSDGKWVVPVYLELTLSDKTQNFVGKEIVGSITGARGFVENVVRRNHNGHVLDVAYMSNVRGNFETGELVSADGVVQDSPQVIGSLTSIDVTVSGSGFEVGQVLDVLSERTGRNGKVRVTDVGKRTGEVNYILQYGGYGYSNNATVFGNSQKIYVSSNVFSITNFASPSPSIVKFDEFDTISQPLTNVSFTSANTTFVTGSLVYGINSSSQAVAGGFILSANQSGANGWLLVSPTTISNASIDTITNAYAPSGSFQPGERVYTTNTTGNASLGVIVYANSTSVTVDQYFGTIQANTLLIGANSNCTANVSSITTIAFSNTNFSNASITKILANNTSNGATKGTATNLTATATVVGSNSKAIGVYALNNTFITDVNLKNYFYSSTTNARASITVLSSGNPGGFKIGGITNTELIFVGTDLLSANNTGGIPFMSLRLNANNSNVSSNAGYGFSHNPTGNSSALLGITLAKTPLTVGSILSLTERSPGSNNTAQPFVVEIEKAVATYGKREYASLTINSQTGSYRIGETVTQTLTVPAISVNVNGVTGLFNTTNRETLKQVRSDGVTVYGDVYSAAVAANTGSLRIIVANTANTFNTSNVITGTFTGINATPTGVVANNLFDVPKGIITQVDTTSITIKRTSFVDMVTGQLILGSESGASANVIAITPDASSNVLGNNAVTNAAAGISDGTLKALQVADSGFSYQDGEEIVLYASNNEITGTGVVNLGKQGQAEGYWRNQDGLLDSNKYVQDNYYYQEYSYEIQSGIDKSKYEDFITKTTHVAGTKLFGSFRKNLVGIVTPSRLEVAYPKITALTMSGVAGTFTQNEFVYQSNGSSNTATGYVLSFNGALNTLQVINTVGTFITSNTVTGANSAAHGTTTSILIQTA